MALNWGRFFGSAGSNAAGFAIGVTAAPALRPAVQYLENEAWSLHPDRPPDVVILAEGVAQGQVDPASAHAWANQQGIPDDAFSALVDIANVGPGTSYAFELWRRGIIEEPGFRRALRRLGLEQEWIDDLVQIKQHLLTPDEIATAVHRGIMRDPSLIVKEPPTTPGDVPQVPPSPLDPVEEAKGSGINHERLRVGVGITGLPPGLMEMLHLLNRGKVTEDDVRRAVSQSNLRNEYMDVVLALRRRLLTPHEYAEAQLRGIMGHDDAQRGANLSGLTDNDYDTLFGLLGRPLNLHEVTTGLARGGKYGGDYSDVPEGPYRDAIRRSAIRPEYADLAFHNRFNYPSAFVLRSLAQAGDLGGEAAVQKVLEEIGWKPAFAQEVAKAWLAPPDGKENPYVAKAENQLWTEAHKAYVKNGLAQGQVAPALTQLDIPAGAQSHIFRLWDEEKTLATAVPPA